MNLPKRILLATNHLNSFGGTEIWLYTMWKGLRDHFPEIEVDVFSADGVSPFPDLNTAIIRQDQLTDHPYDLKLVNHFNMAKMLRFLPGKLIQTVHGLSSFTHLEEPYPHADAWVYVSEEILQDCERCYMKPKIREIIPNPVDDQVFSPYLRISSPNPRILCLCQGQKAIDFVRLYCTRHGRDLRVHNKHQDPLTPVELSEAMEWSDVVIGVGRGALEAMLCDRPVILLDSREYNQGGQKIMADGFMSTQVYEQSIKKNLSGRQFNIQDPSMEWLCSEIKRATQTEAFKVPGNLVCAPHKVRNVINQYLSL